MDIEKTTQLSILLSEIKQLLRSYADETHTFSGKNTTNSQPVFRIEKLIPTEFSEIVIILTQIDNLSKRLWALFLKKEATAIFPHPIHGHSLFRNDLQEIGEEIESIKSELCFFIKVLYEWLYHLKELIQPDIAKPVIQLPGNLNSELQNYCSFRNYYITHKIEREFDMSAPFVEFSWTDSSRLVMLRLPPQDSAITELTNLIENHKEKFMSSGWLEEDNYFRTCQILSSIHYKFEPKSEVWIRIESFFKNNGMVSNTPVAIAGFIKILLKELFSKFATLKYNPNGQTIKEIK